MRIRAIWAQLVASFLGLPRQWRIQGGKGGANAPPLWRLVMYFCLHNCTSPSNDYAGMACSNNNHAGIVTHSRISSLLISRHLTRPRVASVRTSSVTGSGRGSPKICGRASASRACSRSLRKLMRSRSASYVVSSPDLDPTYEREGLVTSNRYLGLH